MNTISFSQIESRRFNLNIYRGKIDEINVDEIRNLITANRVDVLIVRLPSISKPLHYKLTTIGFNCLHADSLVYYSVDLSNHTIPDFTNDLEFEQITAGNCFQLKKMVPVIFNNYKNHYFSNPYLNREKITEGYLEWALAYSTESKNKISWYAKKNGVIAGFATCSFREEKKECEVVLNGVMPDFSGQGIYSDLVRYMQSYFINLGFNRMLISTQLQNYSVQKTWVREGFFLFDSYETYHINSFLDHPMIENM